MTDEDGLRLKTPAHRGGFVKKEVLKPLGLSVTEAADALGVTRPALSALLNERAHLSPDMAIRIEKAFGVSMETLDIRENTGWRYARISGDFNPIHLTARTASMFGFKQAVAHGMWSLGRCLGSAAPQLPNGRMQIDTQFKLPVYLPSQALARTWPVENGVDISMSTPRGDRLHLAVHRHDVGVVPVRVRDPVRPRLDPIHGHAEPAFDPVDLGMVLAVHRVHGRRFFHGNDLRVVVEAEDFGFGEAALAQAAFGVGPRSPAVVAQLVAGLRAVATFNCIPYRMPLHRADAPVVRFCFY